VFCSDIHHTIIFLKNRVALSFFLILARYGGWGNVKGMLMIKNMNGARWTRHFVVFKT
jgi:hypothetical protein